MGPKKKGKANKLAKMSDEERARYLQHRADIEEEARRRKQELIARYMKNKLNKEEIFSRINLAKINQNWRQILRKLKVKDMQQELQMMIVTFTRMTDSKNAVILRLMTSLEEAEDQYSRMLQSHMEMISQFLGICGDRLKFFHDNFEQQKDNLIEQWDDDLQNIEFKHKESEYNLKLIIHQQDESIKEYMDESTATKTYLANRSDMTLQQELNEMKVCKQIQLEGIWNEMRTVFVNYVKYHDPKIQHYQLLREKDSCFRQEINQHMDQLLVSTDIIAHYQHEWEGLTEELELDIKNSKQKRDNIHLYYSKKKEFITQQHVKDKKNMTMLSVESSNALKALESNLIKIKKIIQMESTCQKYEMDGEKVLPWNKMDPLILPVDFDIPENLKDDVKALKLLEKFWFKVSRVSVHASALKAEGDSLRQENQHLKDCLKNFLMEAALGDIKGSNSEISGRPASMKMYRLGSTANGMCEPIIKRPVTCIEGSISNAIIHQQRLSKWKLQSQQAQRIVVRRYCW